MPDYLRSIGDGEEAAAADVAAEQDALRKKKMAIFAGGLAASTIVASRYTGGIRNLARYPKVMAVSGVLGIAAAYVAIKAFLPPAQ